jgi:hypothetical protein
VPISRTSHHFTQFREYRIQAHFAAAQQAQQRNDYATAELEYQTVLVDAPDFANQSSGG